MTEPKLTAPPAHDHHVPESVPKSLGADFYCTDCKQTTDKCTCFEATRQQIESLVAQSVENV